MILNIVLIILILAAIIGVAVYYYNSLKKQNQEDDYDNPYTLDYLTQGVAETFAATLKQNLKELNLSRKALENRDRIKSELRNALKEAAYGNKNSKKFVIRYIRDIIRTGKVKVDEVTINRVIHFSSPTSLKSRDKFEILMHIYRKMKNEEGKPYDDMGFIQMINDYGLKDPILREDGSFYYEVSAERVNEIYDDVMKSYTLTYDDKLDILAQRIFADYKGFGAADVLFDVNLDEIDCGVSGIPKDSYDIKQSDIRKCSFSYESIWVMVSGINIRMSCLSFGTHDELVRVCQNVYKYNAKVSLSKRTGYVASTMKDGSRIVVCRPPFCESWCFFARKFDSAPSIEPNQLLGDKNNNIPLTLAKWIIKGQRTCAITGSQGSGKTTTLKSFIRFISEEFNLRIQELAFELNLRYTYPNRNIVTFQETENITAQEGLNIQKKTNGAVNIIGEVADAKSASFIIQTAMVASLYTLFTHHAKTTYDLIIAIRNNLLETGGYSNEKAAEEMVAKVINVDFHMEKTKGHRYCSRITEIIPIRDRRYPSETETAAGRPLSQNNLLDGIEYYHRVTDRQLFKTVNLVEWQEGEYKLVNMPSEEMQFEIRSKLSAEEEKLFITDMRILKEKYLDGERGGYNA